MAKVLTFVFVLLAVVVCSARETRAQTTEFTYQGSLKNNGTAANGNYDFEFALFDAAAGGAQLGSTLPFSNVVVTNGVFAAKLDFGNQYTGVDRFLSIKVRPTGGVAFTPLTPLQRIDSAPYSVKSLNTDTAATATNALQLGGVAASGYVVTTDPRMTDARIPTAGSTDYIQNQSATPQTPSNFNISGDGTVAGTLSGGIVNATTQFNIDGVRVLLSTGPSANLFVGHSSGTVNTGGSNTFIGRTTGFSNTSGSRNSFVGHAAGANNTTGSDNSFVGYHGGIMNTSGSFNAFFGRNAGQSNSIGSNNSFFGSSAGSNTTTGENSFFGSSAGSSNTTGIFNSFFGRNAGGGNTTGQNNAFFGSSAGFANTSGIQNAFFGTNAGDSNTTGFGNTIIGHSADVGSGNLSVATAIGAGAIVTTSNTVVLGRNLDTVQIPGALNVSGSTTFSGTLSANIFSANTQYNIGGSRVLSIPGSFNFFGGVGAGTNTTAGGNTFVGHTAGQANVAGTSNTIIGAFAGLANTASDNTFVGTSAGLANSSGTLNSFFGANAGDSNLTGSANAFFGNLAGTANTSGVGNSMFGYLAGFASTGGNNAFFGNQAGQATTTGGTNAFYGSGAGAGNTTGSNNSTLGANSNVGLGNLTFATAIGADAVVSTSNTVMLGRAADTVQVPGNLNVTGTFTGNISGAGITNLNASNISSGTLNDARLSANVAFRNAAQTFTGPNTFSGGISGDASGLTNLNASNISSGTLNDARLSANVATRNAGQTFTGANTFSGGISGNGSGLTNLSAGNLTGTVAISNGGTGSATQNFVDLTNDQSIAGNKIFSNSISGSIVNAVTQYNINNNRILSAAGNFNLFAGNNAGTATTGTFNAFFGSGAGFSSTTGNGNVILGALAGDSYPDGSNNTIIGAEADLTANNLTNATAIGRRAAVGASNSLVLGSINGVNNAAVDTNVGIGTTTPGYRLDVADRIRLKQKSGDTGGVSSAGIWLFQNAPNGERAFIGMENDNSVGLYGNGGGGWSLVMDTQTGVVRIVNLAAAGSTTLCRNASQEISTCSSSLKYKTNIGGFSPGLSFVNKLRPISFDWKDGGMKDIGFGAEDVAKIDSRFVTYNDKGEVEGVKYDRLSVAFVNAFKEQQAQIKSQQKDIAEQSETIKKLSGDLEKLKTLFCSQNYLAAGCKPQN